MNRPVQVRAVERPWNDWAKSDLWASIATSTSQNSTWSAPDSRGSGQWSTEMFARLPSLHFSANVFEWQDPATVQTIVR